MPEEVPEGVGVGEGSAKHSEAPTSDDVPSPQAAHKVPRPPPTEKVPAAQSSQLLPETNCPPPHTKSAQEALPPLDVCPAAQGVHKAAPASENVLAGHSEHKEAPPSPKEPPGHKVHVLSTRYSPAAQRMAVQFAAPLLDRVPTAQLKHDEAEGPE